MAKESLWQAAAGICVLLAATPALAQTRYSPQYPQQSYQYPAPNPALSTIVGTYKSDAFFPSPLILTITGADRYGNLSGSLGGYRSSPAKGETLERWETWQRTFGRDARAVYRDGRITITFPNGATYTLDNRGGNELAGAFTAKAEHQAVVFRKSQGFAQR